MMNPATLNPKFPRNPKLCLVQRSPWNLFLRAMKLVEFFHLLLRKTTTLTVTPRILRLPRHRHLRAQALTQVLLHC